MNFVDFFAGIGGIRLGLEQAGHKCVGFCEFDKYARTAYKAMYDTEGEWESRDVRTVRTYDIPDADLWCFGFPCQDISVAGKQKGLQEGERSGLFYEIMRLLAGRRQEDRPRWLLVENVKNLLSIGNGFDFARLLLEVGGTGTLSNGTLSTAKTTVFPKTGSACSLSAILETSVDEKYFLSDEQTARILANSRR
ncbi:DNA cytosine methyltransferase [Phascolarctobacterium succinatutens]|uniref:DNA cytosine methyltransferase n=1 Tax=Phascolarctobacterium succinatutens TaxID=626940 RepID=UPI003AEFB2F2